MNWQEKKWFLVLDQNPFLASSRASATFQFIDRENQNHGEVTLKCWNTPRNLWNIIHDNIKNTTTLSFCQQFLGHFDTISKIFGKINTNIWTPRQQNTMYRCAVFLYQRYIWENNHKIANLIGRNWKNYVWL